MHASATSPSSAREDDRNDGACGDDAQTHRCDVIGVHAIHRHAFGHAVMDRDRTPKAKNDQCDQQPATRALQQLSDTQRTHRRIFRTDIPAPENAVRRGAGPNRIVDAIPIRGKGTHGGFCEAQETTAPKRGTGARAENRCGGSGRATVDPLKADDCVAGTWAPASRGRGTMLAGAGPPAVAGPLPRSWVLKLDEARSGRTAMTIQRLLTRGSWSSPARDRQAGATSIRTSVASSARPCPAAGWRRRSFRRG